MFGQRGRRWAQGALAAIAGSALLLGSAAPAVADDKPATGIATGGSFNGVVLMLDGSEKRVGSLALTIGGQTKVPVYCIDFSTPVGSNQEYTEGSWQASRVGKLPKVQWILAHGFPNVDGAKLLTAAGVDPATVDPDGRDRLLYFGTQAAVWHFSDEIELGPWVNDDDLTRQADYNVIKAVYDYLIKNAVDQAEPKSELAIDPASATAKVGEKAGPFTVKGPAGPITITVTGGQAVDADGKPVTTVTNDGKFWLTATQVGEVSVKATAENAVSFGRVFLHTATPEDRQKLILGASVGETLTASAKASFTAVPTESTSSPAPSPSTSSPAPSTSSPAPSTPAETPSTPAPSTTPVSNDGDLPLTGSATGAVIGGGLLLLLVGGAALFLVRRRKVTFTS